MLPKHSHFLEGLAMDQRDRRARVAVAGAYLVQGFCFAALLTHVGVLQEKFGFSDGELSLVLLAVPVVAGIGSVVAGLFSSRYGSSPVLRVRGPGLCVPITLVGLTRERWQLCLALASVA